METQPFYKSTLEPASIWSKLTGKRLEKNAIVEINNLLAEKPLLEITAEDILTILDTYQLKLHTNFTDGSLRELYKIYLRYCFEDNHLDEEEIKRLKHLKRLLGLSEQDVDMAHHRVCQEIYERELEVALEDYRLDEKERRFLKDLRTKLQLPAEVADRLYQHKAESIIFQFIKGTLADERLSSQEEDELDTLVEQLQIEPKMDDATQRQLATYRLLWQIENRDLPVFHVPIELLQYEKCHFLMDAGWHDDSSSPKDTPNGPPLAAKLLEGSYWRPAEGLVLSENMKQDAPTGKLYLTNQRLIFRTEKQEKYIRLDNILDFRTYQDGIFVYNNKGQNVILATPTQADVFAILLGRVLRDKK